MKIPKKVKIGGYYYKIKLEKSSAELGKQYMGLCKPDELTITLDKNLNPHTLEAVLWHEILHAIFHHASADETPIKDQEEYIIDFMSNGLYQVLHDNNLLK